MVHPCVGPEVIASVISGWTGVPVGKMLRDELGAVPGLEKHPGARVTGQAHDA